MSRTRFGHRLRIPDFESWQSSTERLEAALKRSLRERDTIRAPFTRQALWVAVWESPWATTPKVHFCKRGNRDDVQNLFSGRSRFVPPTRFPGAGAPEAGRAAGHLPGDVSGL